MFKYIGMPVLMPLMGMSHKLEKGAARYIKAINDESLISVTFYASAQNSLVGPVTDQKPFLNDLGNTQFQDKQIMQFTGLLDNRFKVNSIEELVRIVLLALFMENNSN